MICRNTIKLYDLVINQTIVISHLMFEETLAGGTERSIEELTRRLKEYEHIVDDLLHVSSLVAFWGKPDHSLVIRRALTSLTEARILIEQRKKEYNQVRLHNAKNHRPPAPEPIVITATT